MFWWIVLVVVAALVLILVLRRRGRGSERAHVNQRDVDKLRRDSQSRGFNNM
jgi:hypothetical protein